jgi:hypothetical protein
VLYQCLAGRLPFPETNLMTQMLKHATEKPPPITTFAPDVPLPLLGVVDRLMAKLPEQRYPTPATAAEALAPFLAANGAIPAPAAVVPAFQKWLETESHLQVPEFLPDPRATGTAPAPIGGPLPGSGAVPPAATASRPVPVAPPRPPATSRRTRGSGCGAGPRVDAGIGQSTAPAGQRATRATARVGPGSPRLGDADGRCRGCASGSGIGICPGPLGPEEAPRGTRAQPMSPARRMDANACVKPIPSGPTTGGPTAPAQMAR